MLGKHRLAMIQFAMLAVLSMALMGCGRGAQFTVSGTVTLGDKPLADAYVVFEPLIGSPGQVSQGKTDAQGVFTLVSADGHEGALVGPHQVKLTTIPPDAMDDERSPLPRDRVPARYRYEPLEFEVAPEGTDAANFALLNR